MIVYELLKSEGTRLFSNGDPQRACFKYEEGLSIWTYFYSHNPNWETEGIDDSELVKVDTEGKNQKEVDKIRDIKLNSYLNIAVCCLKTK